VTITTRMAVLAAVVCFGIVQRLDGDEGKTALSGKTFGVAAGLATHEERYLLQLLLGVGCLGATCKEPGAMEMLSGPAGSAGTPSWTVEAEGAITLDAVEASAMGVEDVTAPAEG